MKRFVVALMVAGALAGCVAEGETFDAVHAPEWQAGYQYAYQMSGTAGGSAAVKVNGELVDSDESSEPIEAQPYLIYEVLTNQATLSENPIYLAAAQIDDFMELLGGSSNALAVRQTDLSPILAAVTGGKLSGQVPPGDAKYLDFPLTPGKQWTYALPNNSPDDEMIGDYIINAEATKIGKVTAPAGTFDAIHVVARASFPDMSGLIKEMEDEFRSAGMSDVNIVLKVKLHVLTDYAPAVMNVVREQTIIDVDLRLTFSDGSEKYDLHAVAGVDVVSELLGAELTVIPDLGQAGAVAAIAKGRAPIDPTGSVTLSGGPVSLTINATESEVNAAESPEVGFSISATGVPEGMFVTYQVRDAAGKTVASGEGTEFSHTFVNPGVHRIVAKVTDGNGFNAASATTFVTADYDGVLTAACGPVSASTVASCSPVQVSIAPGPMTSTFSVVAQSAGMAGTPGSLQLSGPQGQSYSSSTNNGETTLSPELTGEVADVSAWTLKWTATAGAAEQATFHVVLDYDAPATAQASSTGMLSKVSPSFQLASLLESAGIEL